MKKWQEGKGKKKKKKKKGGGEEGKKGGGGGGRGWTDCRWHGAFSILIQRGLSLACLFIRFRPIQSHLCHKPYVKRAVSYAKRALRHMEKTDLYEIRMA